MLSAGHQPWLVRSTRASARTTPGVLGSAGPRGTGFSCPQRHMGVADGAGGTRTLAWVKLPCFPKSWRHPSGPRPAWEQAGSRHAFWSASGLALPYRGSILEAQLLEMELSASGLFGGQEHQTSISGSCKVTRNGLAQPPFMAKHSREGCDRDSTRPGQRGPVCTATPARCELGWDGGGRGDTKVL